MQTEKIKIEAKDKLILLPPKNAGVEEKRLGGQQKTNNEKKNQRKTKFGKGKSLVLMPKKGKEIFQRIIKTLFLLSENLIMFLKSYCRYFFIINIKGFYFIQLR